MLVPLLLLFLVSLLFQLYIYITVFIADILIAIDVADICDVGVFIIGAIVVAAVMCRVVAIYGLALLFSMP